MPATGKMQLIKNPHQYQSQATGDVTVTPLYENDRAEALQFLAVRPLHTVILTGWILDNGIISPHNRGIFHGCRDAKGRLIGIALIGKNTLFEVRTNKALEALSKYASGCPDIRMVLAEGEKLSKFWYYYAQQVQSPRLSFKELLMEVREVSKKSDVINELRLATENDLDQVVFAHAQMVLEETGSNLLETDFEGFKMRCADRIKKGRVWVWIKNGELIFKTDVVSDTPEAIYIEGVWVNPTRRRNGYSKLCLASLCQQLLNGSNAVCGFVDVNNVTAQALYQKIGFSVKDRYAKIYL